MLRGNFAIGRGLHYERDSRTSVFYLDVAHRLFPGQIKPALEHILTKEAAWRDGDVVRCPVWISSDSLSTAANTFAWVCGRSSPSSGSR
jgi:hypothetical protein